MDILDEMFLNQIGDIKNWSGIMSENGVDRPEWPSRMIFRFVVASSVLYEIIGTHVLEDIHSPFSFFDLYATGTWKVEGFDEPVFIREKLCENRPLEYCLKKAKEDYEKMCKGDGEHSSNDSSNIS